MTLLTIYALFGDDIRMAGTDKESDDIFFSLSCVCLFFFAFEIGLNNLARKEYRFSFYFWLDFIAMISLIPDIGWFWDPITGQNSGGGKGSASLANAGKASRAGTRAGRVIRIIRVVRLIRIVKLYKNAQNRLQLQQQKSTVQEVKPNNNQLNVSHIQEATGRRNSKQSENSRFMFVKTNQQNISITNLIEENQEQEMENIEDLHQDASINLDPGPSQEFSFPQETRVSKKLFDLTTRKVILIVMILLFCLPTFETSLYFQPSASYDYSIDLLFRYYRFRTRDEFYQQANYTIDQFKDSRYPCTYIYLEHKGFMYEYQDIDPDHMRTAEKHYATNNQIVAVFDLRADTRLSAGLNVCRTIFVCIVLVLAALFFNNDTNTLVLVPIERMMERVKRIAKNPLAAAQKQEDPTDILALEEQARQESNCCKCCNKNKKNKEEEAQYETAVLENTIIKIGVLLALGFGEAGGNVIATNMEKGDGEVNPMIDGLKTVAIFGFCDIRNFTDATEVLQEKVMLFVNEIAEVTHGIVNKYGGAANKNIGDAFLLV